MISFDFAEKNSYKDFGIIISKRPNLPSPKRRVTYVDIPGRDSSLTYDEKTYENITIGVECKVKDGSLLEKIDEIKAWLLSAGESDLIFSFNDNKKYKAQVVNSIDFSQIAKKFSEFIIIFNCRPFKYAKENHLFIIKQSGSSIINPGSIVSEPIISIYGTGNIDLLVNGSETKIINLTDKIILNSVMQDAYDDLGKNLNSSVKGEFIYLKPGSNLFEWAGNISKIEILPNWRWL